MLHLTEFGVHTLELGCLSHEHVQLQMVADRHLVEEPAELGLRSQKIIAACYKSAGTGLSWRGSR